MHTNLWLRSTSIKLSFYRHGLYLLFLSLVFFCECSWNTVHLTLNINQSIKNHIRFYLCPLSCSLIALPIICCYTWGRRGRNRMVVGFTTTYAISDYHHWCCEFESRSWRGVQHYVIKFVSDLRQVGSFLRDLHQQNWRHDITEILLKVALNTIKQTNLYIYILYTNVYIYILVKSLCVLSRGSKL